MKIISAEFLKSAVEPTAYVKEDLPEVAFVGRSNVGKSSLVNSLLNRKSLVKVSSSPGKTQLINFFKINDKFIFVDLPGYGFARAPEIVKKKWARMIETYLEYRENLNLVVLILDIRHKPTEKDRLMVKWLDHYQIETVLVTTKSDKIKKSAKNKQIKLILDSLSKQEKRPIIFSAKDGEGKKELWKIIGNFI